MVQWMQAGVSGALLAGWLFLVMENRPVRMLCLAPATGGVRVPCSEKHYPARSYRDGFFFLRQKNGTLGGWLVYRS
ncbi:hypothetical protein AmDm5_3120 [Acetobacter malorum]|nr:hypothetical protein AmDm5_3120 [Acetobacter malorum]